MKDYGFFDLQVGRDYPYRTDIPIFTLTDMMILTHEAFNLVHPKYLPVCTQLNFV